MHALALRLKPVTQRNFFQFLLFSAFAGAAALFIHSFGAPTAAGLLVFATLIALGFFDFKKFLLSALLIRSALDGLQEVSIPLGPLNLNPAGAFGLLLIFFSALHLSRHRKELVFPVVKGFLVFLLFLLPAVWAAFAHFGGGGMVAVKEFLRLLSLLALLISLLSFFREPREMKKLFWAALDRKSVV